MPRIPDMIDQHGYNLTDAMREATLFMQRHWPPQPDSNSYFDAAIADLENTAADHPITWTLLSAALFALEVEWIMQYESITADEAAEALEVWQVKITPRKAAEAVTAINSLSAPGEAANSNPRSEPAGRSP